MTDWSHGYLADSPYTFSYQTVQTPGHIAWVAAMAGIGWQPPADLTLLDIGCGRGLTVNVLAAANPGWTAIGLDYNPAHIAEARELADAAGLGNAGFVEADLATLTDAEIDQLPECDVVTLHGVWTWVADPVRAGIVRLLARRLKPGGVCYVGYNVLPGFAADGGLQRLIRHLAGFERQGDPGARVQAALTTVRALAATRPANLPPTPMLKRLTGDEAPLDPAYLAHEFLTAHWRPVYHEDLCAALAPAKLSYVGSSTLHENMPDLLFTAEQRAIHDAMPPGPPRECIKDLCIGRPFRRDVFMRGPRPVDRDAALDRLVVAANRALPTDHPRLDVPLGIAEIDDALYAPIAAALRTGPQSLGRLRTLTPGRAPNAAELLAILSAGLVLPVLREAGATARCMAFNQALFEATRANGATQGQLALASPMIGGGLPCAWLELAVATQPEALAEAPPDRGAADAIVARLLGPLGAEESAAASGIVARLLAERPAIWRGLGILPGPRA